MFKEDGDLTSNDEVMLSSPTILSVQDQIQPINESNLANYNKGNKHTLSKCHVTVT